MNFKFIFFKSKLRMGGGIINYFMKGDIMNNANANHKANQANANKGTSGQNPAHAKVHGNRGAQLNPNNKK